MCIYCKKEKFAGLNFYVFHFQEYCINFLINIYVPLFNCTKQQHFWPWQSESTSAKLQWGRNHKLLAQQLFACLK